MHYGLHIHKIQDGRPKNRWSSAFDQLVSSI